MWIKICGTTSLEDALVAVNAGADALGFVFAKSPRQVTPEQVAAMTRELPPEIERIGVFVDAGLEAICAAVETAGLTGVQLHGGVGAADVARRLRERMNAPGFRILRVLHYDASFEDQLAELEQDRTLDAVLVDSRSAHAMGGTGIRFDWDAASGPLQAAAPRLRVVVAGGLSPDNVAEAIHTLAPWGVDVVSGVEAAPGRKDPARVKQFITTARAATESRAAKPRMENR